MQHTRISCNIVDNDTLMGVLSYSVELDSWTLNLAAVKVQIPSSVRSPLTIYARAWSVTINCRSVDYNELCTVINQFSTNIINNPWNYQKKKIFRNHIKIRVFTDVFKRYQKESFVKTVINTLDIDCTGDKFTRTKRRTQGNFFLVRPVHVSHVSW